MQYYYENETVAECKTTQKRRLLLFCVVAAIPILIVLTQWLELRSSFEKCAAILTLGCWVGMFLFFHLLIARIENFTIKHAKDSIVEDDKCIEMISHDEVKLTLCRDKLQVRYRYYASGSAIFDTWNTDDPQAKISFSTHLKNYEKLVHSVDASCWPPSTYEW